MTLFEPALSQHTVAKRIAVFFTKPRGDRRWDLLLRSTGIVGLAGIPIVAVFPRLVPLVWLAVLGLPACGPLGPVLPTAFEPLLMEAAKHEQAIWVTLVALGIYLYMEYLNWHIYGWVLSRRRFARLKEERWIRWSIKHFKRAPFATVVVFAASPLPYWAIRALAIMDGYPLRPYMIATAIGRFPRLYLYAWLGAVLRIPTVVLVGVIFGTAAVVVVHRLARGKRVLAQPVGAALSAAGVEQVGEGIAHGPWRWDVPAAAKD